MMQKTIAGYPYNTILLSTFSMHVYVHATASTKIMHIYIYIYIYVHLASIFHTQAFTQ